MVFCIVEAAAAATVKEYAQQKVSSTSMPWTLTNNCMEVQGWLLVTGFQTSSFIHSSTIPVEITETLCILKLSLVQF